MPNGFSFTYDPRLRNGAGGYRDNRTGRVVSNFSVRSEFDRAIDRSQLTTSDLAVSLREGQIDLKQWQLSMRRLIKNSHLNAAAIEVGGWSQMTQSDFGRVGQRIRLQYGYLDNFAQQISDGLPLDGRFVTRCKMYDEAAINTYHRFERNDMRNAGFDEERSVLDAAAKHCNGCIDEAARGWVRLDDPRPLVPIGERTCLTRCRCSMQYRNSETGDVIE